MDLDQLPYITKHSNKKKNVLMVTLCISKYLDINLFPSPPHAPDERISPSSSLMIILFSSTAMSVAFARATIFAAKSSMSEGAGSNIGGGNGRLLPTWTDLDPIISGWISGRVSSLARRIGRPGNVTSWIGWLVGFLPGFAGLVDAYSLPQLGLLV
ncbi:hypothetical protein CRG98_019394 [Punica granatum]|uniref:Uncharacterized protein n=1 Tax=Punica granatum TaxID=22663 RepID=A0A2I0JXL8_PUNGR|nr:hypothetical protein CRG98_019394 [Punica granatum]